MSEETLQQLDRSIRANKAFVDAGNALERLNNNKDFKKVVIEGFLQTEAIRLVHLKADPSMQSEESQKSIMTQIDAIGTFKQYLTTVSQFARLGAKALADDEQTREEILAGGNGND